MAPGFVNVSISSRRALTGFSVGWWRLPVYSYGITSGSGFAGSAGRPLAST